MQENSPLNDTIIHQKQDEFQELWDFSMERIDVLEDSELNSEYAPWCDGQGGCEDSPSCHVAPDSIV